MPWGVNDATRHTHKADTSKRKRQWSAVANNILERTGDEGRAVRGANSAVNKSRSKSRTKRRRKGVSRRRTR